MYRTLDSKRIIDMLEMLHRRIEERFPTAGLSGVCSELIQVARDMGQRADRLARPNMMLRFASLLVMAAGVALLGYVGLQIEVKHDSESVFSVLQGVDAFFNIIVLMGAAVYFLASLEGRIKARQALADLHELRSIIHVVDMHQLTKDPSSTASLGGKTPSSPKRDLTPFELTRYLNYCSEMLSLAAKVAALYAQTSRDPIVVEASSDLQQITSNLSNKIWQKITIAQAVIAQERNALAAPAIGQAVASIAAASGASAASAR
jgi:hypothetical protein